MTADDSSQLHLESFEKLNKSLVFFMLKPCHVIYYFLYSLCIIIIVFFIWASFAPMNDIVTAKAIVRPQSTISSIKCLTGGQVIKKNYTNDSMITAGDLLFSFDISSLEKDLDYYQIAETNLIKEIKNNNILLEAIKNEMLPNTNDEQELVTASTYIYSLKQYQNQIEKCKLNLKREIEIPASVKVPQKEEDLRIALSEAELSMNVWKNSQLTTALSKKDSLENSLNSIQSKIVEIERAEKNSVFYAPISGRIYEIRKMNVGDFLLGGEEVVKIFPENMDALKVDLYIDPSYIACLKIGNPVHLKFPGLPPSRFGQVETTISFLPPDVTLLNESNTIYIAEAIIDSTSLKDRNGFVAQLLPGITAEARIIIDKTTVMKMILRKLDFIQS